MRIILLFILLININAKQTIKLATESWPPFSYEKNGKITGLSTDIIYATFKKMGIKISSNRVMPWVRTQNLGYYGKVDAVYTASINDERKKYMYFPDEPIIKSKWVLFIKKDNKDKLKFDNFKSLKGKKFCLIRGYNYPKEFKEYITKNSKITYTSTEYSNIEKLMHSRCDYMPAVLETTLYLTKHNEDLKKINAYKNIYYFEKPLSVTNFYLMFSKKRVSKKFVDKFSNTLKELKKTKEYQDIVKKYF